MGQRLVRAKNKIRQAGIPFRVPDRADLAQRLDAVLDAIYAAFAEGWSDPRAPMRGGAIWRRKRSGWAAWSRRCCPASPKRWACSR